MSPRHEKCFRSTLAHLPDQTSRLYVEKYFSETDRVDIRLMLQKIRSEFSADLAHLSWMDESTRERAVRKLSAMDFQIGYPDGWRELRRLPPLELSPQDYLDNTMKIMVRSSSRSRQRLFEPVDHLRWSRPAAVVNAFYSPDRNVLFIPAGILQPPFFEQGGSLAGNYGGIGSILGHEISHSLDDSGSRYDEEGRLNDWWDADTLTRFKARTRCVADRFSEFVDAEGGHVNGNLTLGETIADSGVREHTHTGHTFRGQQVRLILS
jgi:putative endopeptidase